MNAQQTAIAEKCRAAACDGSMAFPDIIAALLGAGFEGYAVDYRRNVNTYYLPDGDSVELANEKNAGAIAAAFDPEAVTAAVREAQAGAPGYTYKGFCAKVAAAGCAGYMVSFSGRRVVYYGRTAETLVETFPS